MIYSYLIDKFSFLRLELHIENNVSMPAGSSLQLVPKSAKATRERHLLTFVFSIHPTSFS